MLRRTTDVDGRASTSTSTSGGVVRRPRGSDRDQHGAAAVEFALILLPFFLLIFGMIQYGIYTLGVIIMIPSLYFLLGGNPAFEPLVAAGSMIVFAGVLLFAYMVFSREPASRTEEAVART